MIDKAELLCHFLYHFAKQAGDNCSNKGAGKGNRNGIKQFFDFGLGNVNRCNIENGFAATHYHAGTTRNVAVSPVCGKNVF